MKNLLSIFCLFLFIQAGISQFSETFTGGLNDWSVNNASSNWTYSLEGIALSHNWNNRPPIASETNNELSGAAIFNGDSLSAVGTTENLFILTSPEIITEGFEKPILSFFQYFKNYEGEARVEVSVNGEEWIEFPVNENYGNFMETPNDDRIFIDISSAIFSEPIFQIRFIYEGVGAFWIIDDIRVDNISDLLTPDDESFSYPETFPAELMDELCEYDYPFYTDSFGGAYIPDEWVILYTPDATEGAKDSVRQMFQITDYETCNCSDLELWKNPIVIEPIKLDLQGSDFPNDNTSAAVEFPVDFNESATCTPESYSFTTNLYAVCNDGVDFNQHTPDISDSKMLLIRGSNQAGFSIPDITLMQDSLYVFSFFAHSAYDPTVAEIDISVAGIVYESITIGSQNDWQRFDIKLDIPTGGGGIIEFNQTNTGGLYAIDDLCIAQYILGESDAIGLNGLGDKPKSCIRVQELDENYYNFDLLNQQMPSIPILDNPDFQTTPTPLNTELVIAVLDSGIDYQDEEINNYLFNSTENLCYTDSLFGPDYYGYDFVDNDCLPYDEHWGGHGTHVASIIINNMNAENDGVCDYKILPIRTHDEHGLATLFNVTCGTSYAAQRGADYINASWGYYAEESPVLSAVINQVKTSNDVMIICSAGNEGLDIGTTNAYPAGFNRTNVITVGATNSDNNNPTLASFSNRNDFLVHFATEGVDINATVPPHVGIGTGQDAKNGTSMAAPRLLAATVLSECHCDIPEGREVLRYILNNIDAQSPLSVQNTEARNGRFIDLTGFQSQLTASNCGRILDHTDQPVVIFPDLEIFPNPASNEIYTLTDALNDESLEYQIIDLSGQLVNKGDLQQNYQAISIQDLRKGLYFLKLIGNQGVRTIPFIKS